MFDYIFYSATSRQRLIDWLEAHEVPYELADAETGSGSQPLVRVPEDLSDALLEDLDTLYDDLFAAEEALLAEAEGTNQQHVAGISFNVADGSSLQVPVDPALLNRLLQVVTMEELGAFVQTLVDSIEQPDRRPFCEQARDKPPRSD